MPKTAVQLNILKIKASLAGFYGSRRNAHSKTSIRKTFPQKVAPEEKCWPHGKLPPAHHGKSAYFFQSEHSQRETETDTYTERNTQKPTVDKPMHQYLFSHKCATSYIKSYPRLHNKQAVVRTRQWSNNFIIMPGRYFHRK